MEVYDVMTFTDDGINNNGLTITVNVSKMSEQDHLVDR